jgi:3-oxoacyl-[acyl-carrier-protein] synthase I
MSVVITGINCVTSIGFSAAAISAAVRGPISGFREADEYTDAEGSPVLIAEIPILEGVGDDEDQESRIRSLARFCLEKLIIESFPRESIEGQVYVLIGLPTATRPGPVYQGAANELQFICSELLRSRFEKWAFRFFESGNPSAMEALDYARRFLGAHPETICIVGGIDSLLDSETLDYFEDDARLKSATYGRHQGLIPGEGVGFLVVESGEFARRRNRQPLAEVLGIGIAGEPSPVRSPDPSTFTGLSDACRGALSDSGSTAESICTVIGDLNGEFFRAKEWAYTELRCLGSAHGERELSHPADCFGDVGAASGAVLISLAVTLLRQKPVNSRMLCFCSDDEKVRGAVVLAPYSPNGP